MKLHRDNHWSDCATWNGPAMRPGWCDCGGIDHRPYLWEKIKLFVRYNWLYARGYL